MKKNVMKSIAVKRFSMKILGIKKTYLKGVFFIGITFVIFLLMGQPVYAEEEEQWIDDFENEDNSSKATVLEDKDLLSMEESLEGINKELDEVDYEELQQAMEELLETEDLSFKELMEGFATGEFQLNGQFFKELFNRNVFGNLGGIKGVATQILVLSILAALFSMISSVFGNGQVSDMSFYVVFLILFALLMNSFVQASQIAQGTIEKLLSFVKVVMPAYMLIVAAAGGGTMAVVFYEFFLFLVFVINWLIVKLMLPLIHIYVVLGVVNHISKEDLFSKAAELIKTVVSWALKSVIALVIGFQLIQGLVTPYIDTFKSAALHKTLMSIPGVGNAINGVTEMAVGAGILIKNGMGVTVLIILLLACAVPIVTLGIFVLLFQFMGAVIQPISDKRILNSIGYVKEGNKLLLRCVLITCFLFILTIAVVTASTNGGVG